MLNIAIVGTGMMGKGWTRTVHQSGEARVVAFVDPLIGTDREPPWLAEHPEALRAKGVSSLLADADAAIVTASTPAHEQIIESALALGCHVLVEKPFVTDLAAAQRLVDRAEEAGRVLMVAQNYRYFIGPQLMRRVIREQQYGALRCVAGRFWCDHAGKPYQHEMTHPMLLEMAIHHLDMVRAMADAEAMSGYIREWNSARSPYRMGGAVEALYQMNGGGSSFPFSYSGSLISTAPRAPWAGLWRFEFDQATVVVDVIDGRYGLYLGTKQGYQFISEFETVTAERLGNPFEEFRASINEGREPWSSGRDNLGTLKMAIGFCDSDPDRS